MKSLYINDFNTHITAGSYNILLGWIKKKRSFKEVVFLDVSDSTGSIQVVVNKDQVSEGLFDLVRKAQVESSVRIEGILTEREGKSGFVREIVADKFNVIGEAPKRLTPHARSDFDIFDPRFADHLLRNRHLYIRNDKVMAILRFRHELMGFVHQWFRINGFVEITAPVLTPLPLYEDKSALSVVIEEERVFLTQCVGFYLESAVHAFEKVYNIGPSFRGEESRSKRHLMEYWHIKAEVAFGDLDDIISIVETLLKYIVQRCEGECQNLANTLGTKLCVDGLTTPFPRISYRDALSKLKSQNISIEFGESLGTDEEAVLSSDYNTPFWVTGIPRRIEPFPYVIDPNDTEVTRTADLIASRGYGELLGVAEKIVEPQMLIERMKEKGKFGDPRYEWLRELREYGCVPHLGLGMGVERLIRWLLDIPHVRDTIPFPRSFRRRIYP